MAYGNLEVAGTAARVKYRCARKASLMAGGHPGASAATNVVKDSAHDHATTPGRETVVLVVSGKLGNIAQAPIAIMRGIMRGAIMMAIVMVNLNVVVVVMTAVVVPATSIRRKSFVKCAGTAGVACIENRVPQVISNNVHEVIVNN